jgi:serine protease Do
MTRTLAMVGVAALAMVCVSPAAAQSNPGASGFDLLTLRGAGSSVGLQVTELDSADVKTAPDGGVRVESVTEGTPAARAGFKAADIVVEFDGERIRSARQFKRVVEETRPGREVKAVVLRSGTRQTLTVTPELGRAASAAPLPTLRVIPNAPRLAPFQSPDGVPSPLFEFAPAGRRLGASAIDVGDQLGSYLGVKRGVLVTAVTADTPAARAGLKAGDVITEVNGRPVTNTGDVNSAVTSASGDGRLDLHVIRDKKDLRLTATLPTASTPAPRPAVTPGEPL